MVIIPNALSNMTPLLASQSGSGISRNMRYSGVMITCWGSRFPAVNSISRMRLNRKLNRDRPKAAIDANHSVTITAGMVMIIVLMKNFHISPSCQACA